MSRDKAKLITGNYLEVVQALALPSVFTEPMQKSTYLFQVMRDLPRLWMLCSKKDRVNLIARLALLPEGFSTYTQGDFDGRFLTVSSRNLSYLVYSHFDFWAQNQRALVSDLEFTYLNDDDVLCGFSMSYLYDPSIKEYYFNLAVIENVTATPDKRMLTFISHPMILPRDLDDNLSQIPDIAIKAIPSLLKEKLGSKLVYNLVNNLFSNYQSAFICCRELRKCFYKLMRFAGVDRTE